METRANYVLIGSFVLLAMGAMALFAVWISNAQFQGEYSQYDVVFEGPVNGLTEGGEVRFNGIKVGEVTRLALDRTDPNKVISRIRVDANTPVREDSSAVLNFQGITGVTYIQIRAGDTSKRLLRDVSRENVPRIPTERTQLEELFAGGQDALAETRTTLRRFNDVLSVENVARFNTIMANLETLSDQLADEDGVVEEMVLAIRSLKDAGDTVNEAAVAIDVAATGFDTRFTQLAADATLFLKQADEAVISAQGAFASAESSIDGLASELGPEAEEVLSELSAAATDMRILVRRLDNVARELERDPREFILGDTKPFE